MSGVLGPVSQLLLPVCLAAVFVAGALTVLAVVDPRTRAQRQVDRSLKAVADVPRPAGHGREAELRRPLAERALRPALRAAADLARRFTPQGRLDHLRRRLDLAGSPVGWDPDRVLAVKVLGALALAPAAAGLVQLPAPGPGPGLLAGLAGGLLGWWAPTLWVYQLGYDRTEALRDALPDAIDLLTISVEAGLTFEGALTHVARDAPGPLAGEFYRVLQEMQIGTGRLEALRALAERTDLPELRSFVSAMVQAEAFGVPVAGVLRVQSHELRLKRSQRAEAAAQQVPVKVLFPLIFCILPTLFIVIMGPVAITVMFSGIGR